jgi:hypothetical protein
VLNLDHVSDSFVEQTRERHVVEGTRVFYRCGGRGWFQPQPRRQPKMLTESRKNGQVVTKR